MPIFEISTLGSPTNKITFGLETATGPFYRALRRMPTRREIIEYDIPIPDNHGVADYQTLIGKEYFIIEGKAYPSVDSDYDLMRRALRKVASLTIEQADSQADQGYVPYSWQETDGAKQMYVKVMYCDMMETTRQGLIQPFKLVCKIKNPIITSVAAKVATISIAGGSNNTGGFAIPMAIPLSINTSTGGGASGFPFGFPVAFGGTKTTGSGTISMTGDLPAYPAFQIFGPISKPKIVNVTTGQFIELDVVLSSPSDTAVISYSTSGITINAAGQNAYSKLTTGSTLFTLPTGNNTFTLSGSSVGAQAYATVTAFDTWPIS